MSVTTIFTWSRRITTPTRAPTRARARSCLDAGQSFEHAHEIGQDAAPLAAKCCPTRAASQEAVHADYRLSVRSCPAGAGAQRDHSLARRPVPSRHAVRLRVWSAAGGNGAGADV